MELLITDGGGYGATVSTNGREYYYSEMAKISPDLGVAASVMGDFYHHQHCQIALDAGGNIVNSHQNQWGETVIEAVLVLDEDLIAYCRKLRLAQNPHRGMMQTSAGEWAFADDWDEIEGAM